MQYTVSPLRKKTVRSFGTTCAADINFTSPVNNFLKAPEDIEQELLAEGDRTREFYMFIDGRYMPASEVLRRPMEENY